MQNFEMQESILSCDMILFNGSADYYPVNPEIFAVVEGGLHISQGTAHLKRGAVFFLSQNKTYFRVEDRCVLIRISLSPWFLFNQFPELLDFYQDSYETENSEKTFELIVEYANLYFSETCSKFRTSSLAFYLLERLEGLASENITFHIKIDGEILKRHKIANAAIQYINNNFERDISLSFVSEYFSVSPQYMAGIIKKATGCSFNKYLSSIRMFKGMTYYKYTTLSVEKIEKNLYIKDKAKFENQIISLKRTKEIFLLKPQNFSVLNKATSLTYIFNYNPTGKNKLHNVTDNKIYVQESKSAYLPPVWKQIINLGYAVYFDNVQTFNQLIILQKKIGFQYGRICRIFDLISSYQSDKQIIYDYNRIFRILDVLIENNMYPFIELGNKRLRIQLNIQNTLIPDVPAGHQEYFEYLLNTLPGFICSCINRYGYNSISHWRFEVSAPEYESADINVNFSLTKYIYYFSKIKSCIQNYAPQCQVGGPGFNNWDSPDIFENLLDFLEINKAMPDFLTAYMYPLDKESSSMMISSNQNLLENRMKMLQKAIANRNLQIELWITEFNSNLSSRNFINDSSYQATFIAKTMLAAIRQKIYGLGYYLMSDVPLRYADTIEFLFGGWGLFTDNSIPKPSLHALYMFSMLGTSLEKLSDKYIVTSKPDKSFQILLYHYEHLSHEYRQNNITLEDFVYPEKVFIKNNADSWEIIFYGLKNGYYLIKEYSVTPNQGNILHQWNNLHYITPIREEDQRLIESLSSITPKLYCIKVTQDIPLTMNYILSRQNVKLITLEFFNSIDGSERNVLHE